MVKTNFPQMQLKYVNIEWSKYHGDYLIYFKDKDSENYSYVIGPKYFPVIIGQGLFAIEEHIEKIIKNINFQKILLDIYLKIGKCFLCYRKFLKNEILKIKNKRHSKICLKKFF